MSPKEPPVRVLVVDDDFAVAAVHRAYLESMAEFTVVAEAHSARQALRAAEELSPDLVLLDIHLPDMSGLEVLQRLTDGGNTVLVIEHNLDIIKSADWIIDLGPRAAPAVVRSSLRARRPRGGRSAVVVTAHGPEGAGPRPHVAGARGRGAPLLRRGAGERSQARSSATNRRQSARRPGCSDSRGTSASSTQRAPSDSHPPVEASTGSAGRGASAST